MINGFQLSVYEGLAANFETTRVSNYSLYFMVICLADISLFPKRSSALLYWNIFVTYTYN